MNNTSILQELFTLDFKGIVLGIFVVLIAFISIIEVISKISIIIGKPVKWVKDKDNDHALLKDTVSELKDLKTQHCNDVSKSQEELALFMKEMRLQMKQYSDNRISDREQSFKIQKDLTDSIKIIADSDTEKNEQLKNLLEAVKELMAEKINEKYKSYIKLEGIPEDEMDEFVSLHTAYNGVGGNHHGDAKFKYCMEHLQIIPVETKLVYDERTD